MLSAVIADCHRGVAVQLNAIVFKTWFRCASRSWTGVISTGACDDGFSSRPRNDFASEVETRPDCFPLD